MYCSVGVVECCTIYYGNGIVECTVVLLVVIVGVYHTALTAGSMSIGWIDLVIRILLLMDVEDL